MMASSSVEKATAKIVVARSCAWYDSHSYMGLGFRV